jgi:U3 small nucleolar RNA-associated protein 14
MDVEDIRERQNRLAKMRSLLFRHEMKAKRVKKIKSRTYHRLLKKDKRKASSADLEADPEAAEESAMKQEFKRAEVIYSLFGEFSCISLITLLIYLETVVRKG